MKFAPVTNLAACEFLPQVDYHLALSNQLLLHARLLNFYKRKVRRGATVILDHPIHERLDPPKPEQILELVQELKPTYTIVPDVIGDPEATLVKFDIFSELLRAQGTTPMAVVQGKNLQEYVDSINKLAVRTKAIGIPLIRKYEPIDRCMFIVQLTINGFFDRHPHLKIHLLGADNTLSDARRLRDHKNVIGVDSAKPVYLAFKGVELNPSKLGSKHDFGRPSNYFSLEEKEAYQNASLIRDNVNFASEYVSGVHDETAGDIL